MPLPAKESLPAEEQARLLESGFHLDGSGFIFIPKTDNFPEDNFAVGVWLKPDPPSEYLSQYTKEGKPLHEDAYTIFAQHNGILEDFGLTMHVRENKNGSMIDLTGHDYNGTIVGNISIK